MSKTNSGADSDSNEQVFELKSKPLTFAVRLPTLIWNDFEIGNKSSVAFTPHTAFDGATFRRTLKNAEGEVHFSTNQPNVSVTGDGTIRFIKLFKGDLVVTATDRRNRQAQYTIPAPVRWFTVADDKAMLYADYLEYLSSNQLTRASASATQALVGLWGDLTQQGWPHNDGNKFGGYAIFYYSGEAPNYKNYMSIKTGQQVGETGNIRAGACGLILNI